MRRPGFLERGVRKTEATAKSVILPRKSRNLDLVDKRIDKWTSSVFLNRALQCVEAEEDCDEVKPSLSIITPIPYMQELETEHYWDIRLVYADSSVST